MALIFFRNEEPHKLLVAHAVLFLEASPCHCSTEYPFNHAPRESWNAILMVIFLSLSTASKSSIKILCRLFDLPSKDIPVRPQVMWVFDMLAMFVTCVFMKHTAIHYAHKSFNTWLMIKSARRQSAKPGRIFSMFITILILMDTTQRQKCIKMQKFPKVYCLLFTDALSGIEESHTPSCGVQQTVLSGYIWVWLKLSQ